MKKTPKLLVGFVGLLVVIGTFLLAPIFLLMKKRRLLIALIVLLLLTGIFVITPMLMISRARTLIDEGEPVHTSTNAPTAAFYEGIDLLQTASWFPYFGNTAEDIIMVHMSSNSADYYIEYYMVMAKYQEDKLQKLYDERDSILAVDFETYKTWEIDYPDIDLDAPLTESDRLLFCMKWKRFQEQIEELNAESPELLIFTRDTYVDCN